MANAPADDRLFSLICIPAKAEDEVNLASVHADLTELEKARKAALDKHNAFLKELGLNLLP